MGNHSILDETKEDIATLVAEEEWARDLRKRYRYIMKQRPELADEYDVADAQEVLSEYLFPIEPSLHVGGLVKTLSWIGLVIVEALTAMFIANLLIAAVFPDATVNTKAMLILSSILIVAIPTDIIYIHNRKKSHKEYVSRRAKKLKKWLSKTRV